MSFKRREKTKSRAGGNLRALPLARWKVESRIRRHSKTNVYDFMDMHIVEDRCASAAICILSDRSTMTSNGSNLLLVVVKSSAIE